MRAGHWDGVEWSRVDVPLPSTVWTALAGRADDDLWLLGSSARVRWDGSTLTVVDMHPSSQGAGSAAHLFATDGWSVGAEGRIFRNRGGTEWTLAGGTDDGGRFFTDVVPTSSGDAFVLASDGIWYADASGATRVSPEVRLSSGVEAAPGDLWVAGYEEVFRWDGTSLTPVTSDLVASRQVQHFWASGSDDVYMAAAQESILHWDGSDVSIARDPGTRIGTVTAIDGVDASDVFAVTQDGDILRGSGTTWATVANDEDVWWRSVRALASDDVWVGGGGGTLWHWDGATWTPAEVPDIARPWDRGNSPYAVQIVGDASALTAITDQGHVLRLVGGRWVRDRTLPFRVASAARASDGALWVTSDSNVVRRAWP